MKKMLFIASLILGCVLVQAQVCDGIEEVILQVGFDDDGTVLGERPRSPINPPSASLDDHTFYISGVHSGYTLYLIDNSGEEPDVVYQVVIPAGVNVVVLPANLSGTYELQLYNGGAYYFYAEIDL